MFPRRWVRIRCQQKGLIHSLPLHRHTDTLFLLQQQQQPIFCAFLLCAAVVKPGQASCCTGNAMAGTYFRLPPPTTKKKTRQTEETERKERNTRKTFRGTTGTGFGGAPGPKKKTVFLRCQSSPKETHTHTDDFSRNTRRASWEEHGEEASATNIGSSAQPAKRAN